MHSTPKESFPRQRSRLDMVVNSNGVASASSPIGVKIGIALQWVCMSEGVLDVKGEVKDIASTRRNEHPIETFSSARLFESSGLKRQGFDS